MVVNKADRPGSDKIISELNTTMQMRKSTDSGWAVPVVSTVAVNKENIDKLYGRITEYLDFKREAGTFEGDRKRRIEKKILAILKSRFHDEFIGRLSQQIEFEQYVDETYQGKSSPYDIADELYQRFAGK